MLTQLFENINTIKIILWYTGPTLILVIMLNFIHFRPVLGLGWLTQLLNTSRPHGTISKRRCSPSSIFATGHLHIPAKTRSSTVQFACTEGPCVGGMVGFWASEALRDALCPIYTIPFVTWSLMSHFLALMLTYRKTDKPFELNLLCIIHNIEGVISHTHITHCVLCLILVELIVVFA